LQRVSDLAYAGRLGGVGEPLSMQLQRGGVRLAVQIVPDEIPLDD